MSTKAVPERGKVLDEEKIHHLLYNLNTSIFQQSLRFKTFPVFTTLSLSFRKQKNLPPRSLHFILQSHKVFFIINLNGRTHIYIFSWVNHSFEFRTAKSIVSYNRRRVDTKAWQLQNRPEQGRLLQELGVCRGIFGRASMGQRVPQSQGIYREVRSFMIYAVG